jgi:hypothetical protein
MIGIVFPSGRDRLEKEMEKKVRSAPATFRGWAKVKFLNCTTKYLTKQLPVVVFLSLRK